MQGSRAAPMEVLRGRDTHLAQVFKQKALDIRMYHDVPPVWALALLNSARTQCRGRKERPWKSRVAVVHTWRNIRGRKRWTFEDVEKDLHERDQEELDKKRDPEEPHK